MSIEKRKQLALSVVFILLICLFTGAGLWFRGHPLFTGQGLRISAKPAAPVSTYVPYEAAVYSSTAAATPIPLKSTEPIHRFYTIDRAVVFTFSGLGNEAELQSVLDVLEKTDSRATFFVTAEEMERYPEMIEAISRAGQEFGIAYLPAENDSAALIQQVLQSQAETLRKEYQARYEIFVRPSFGSGSAALLEAAAGSGMRVLTQFKEAVPEKVTRMTDAEKILSEIFNDNEGMLQRGEIVHFQMGLFQYSGTVLGKLVEKVITEKCCYPVCAASEIAADKSALYTYPVPEDDILPEVQDKVYPGHLAGKTPDEIYDVIRKGYIGIDWVVSSYFLPGFNEWQASHLDRTGKIKNDDNDVFLTFDDWGTDETVDKLLSVLEKHNVTATFFVKTEHVPNNPNLLRAIAAAGHTIGAHSHKHLPLSTEVYPTYFEELDEEDRQIIEDDIVECYNTMQSIIGDMTDADGKPSLSLLFRPPTLAVGRNGLETVFDCGYTHSISGYYTSTDYKAESAEALAADLKPKIVSGAIIVMHFSDTAQYTADALDILLTDLEASGKEFHFVGLNKVL